MKPLRGDKTVTSDGWLGGIKQIECRGRASLMITGCCGSLLNAAAPNGKMSQMEQICCSLSCCLRIEGHTGFSIGFPFLG